MNRGNWSRGLAIAALMGASLLPVVTRTAAAAPSGCGPVAFVLDDVQGIYDGANIELHVYPCGGVAVSTGTNGTLAWGSPYYGSERLVDGSVLIKFAGTGTAMSPLDYSTDGVVFNRFPVLVITPNVPGVIHLWGVAANGAWFDTYLNKTSDDPG